MSNNKTPYIGQKYYRLNKKTKALEDFKIVDVLYVLNRKIGSRMNFTQNELENMIHQGELSTDTEVLKKQAIAKLEEQFGIKLKEV